MRNYKKTVRACLMYVFVVIAAAGYPLSAFAQVAPDSSTATQVVTEPPKETYTFNPDTNHWDTNKWQFDPVSGQYQPKPPVAPVAPEPAAPVAPVAPVTPGLTSATSSPSTTGTGEQTLPVASSDTTVSTTTNVGNNLTSQAQTGSAGVQSNTAAGSATSGDAAATTTVVNAVHSTVQGGTEGIAHFSADIYGNVIGDITLAPALEDALAKSSSQPSGDTTIQSSNDTSLTNNLTLGATSGDASVTDNTKAGDATTGTANTVANVINLINSIIAANQSFVGTINIYGNLNGDILISPTFIPQLLASNASDGDGSTSTVLGIEDTQSIINNVSLNAASGTANVADNTKAGNATTGTAATNLTILNYTGHEVVASNSLLVFVNVLGKWVGIIVDAPVGATAAAIGNGVTSNVGSGGDQTIDANNKSTITNNIDLTSLSGNANVTGNTSAGNATSGNATASANIANISTSSFSISDWFGILFINVYGTWLGSFGVDTENGTVTPITASPVTPLSETPANVVNTPQFGFRPHTRDSHTGRITPVIDPPVQAEVASILISQPEATVASDDNIPTVISEAPQTNPYSFVMIMASLIGAAVAAAIGLYRRQDSFPG